MVWIPPLPFPRLKDTLLTLLLLASHVIVEIYAHPTSSQRVPCDAAARLEPRITEFSAPQDNASIIEPAQYWRLSKNRADASKFIELNGLIEVEYTAQDAAMMPSWPQAFLQYILIAPPINFRYSSRDTYTTTYTHSTSYGSYYVDASTPRSFAFDSFHSNAFPMNPYSSQTYENTQSYSRGFTVTPFNVLQVLFSPVLFPMWTASFGMAQNASAGAGWVSVLGWATWFDIIFLFSEVLPVISIIAVPMLMFQWVGSFAVVIQRWGSPFGDVAYRITSLNGCTPADGLAYLQQGARSRSFRIVQSVTFPLATLFMLLSIRKPERFAGWLALLVLGELIYTAVVASKGIPVVVSGNCVLVELSPRLGFLDTSVSTKWKAFGSFMGF